TNVLAESGGKQGTQGSKQATLMDLRGAACNAEGEIFFLDTAANKAYRIDSDGAIHPFLSDAGHANSLTIGPKGEIYAVSSITGKILRYDASGKSSPVVDGVYGQYLLATPGGGLYVTVNKNDVKSGRGVLPAAGTRGNAVNDGEVWFVKEGRKQRVATGLK